MIATLVATKEGHWAAYIATQKHLDQKQQPDYFAPYTRPSEVIAAINKKHPEQFEHFTDYGDFWQQVAYAGIDKPENMPHRQPVVVGKYQGDKIKGE